MLRTLIVEDEFTSRMILNTLLLRLGRCDVAVNGKEAIEAFAAALKEGTGYHLVCLDITMPGMDGHAVLKEIRQMERAAGLGSSQGVKVIMTTAHDQGSIAGASRSKCDAFLLKPIAKTALMSKLSELGLLA